MLSLCINAVCFSCFLSLRLSHTHTHTQVHSVLVFTLPSVCVFYLFLYSLQLFSYRHGCYLGRLAFYLSFFLNTPFLSYSLPPSFSFLTLFFFLCFCLLLSFSLSFPTTPPSLFIFLLYSLSLTQFLSVSHPPLPLPPTLLSLSLFLYLSLSFLTQSISHSPFLSLPSFTCFLNHPFSLTHLLFFSVSFSLPLSDCFKSSNYKLHGYQGIQVPLLISCSLSLCTPPPHTHTHNLFSFYFPCLCLSVSLSLSVAPSLFPLCMVVFLNLKSILCSFLFFKNKSRYQLVRGDNVC